MARTSTTPPWRALWERALRAPGSLAANSRAVQRVRTRSARAGTVCLHAAPLLVASLLALGGCSSPGPQEAPPSVIGAERFIAAYVDLRLAALRAGPGGEVEPAERHRILARHGVTADDLVRFVERYGSDPEFMAAVWDTIERRIQERSQGLDSGAAERR